VFDKGDKVTDKARDKVGEPSRAHLSCAIRALPCGQPITR